MGSRFTGVPLVYKYLRDSFLDSRDKAYCDKKKLPFVPRVDPDGVQLVYYIARFVCAEDGTVTTEYVY